MVYDASKSGLNKALWVPSFPLPMAETLSDLLEEDSWMADVDMGEMFLNFPLDVNIREFCGVDLYPAHPHLSLPAVVHEPVAPQIAQSSGFGFGAARWPPALLAQYYARATYPWSHPLFCLF
jgi:hypothetical protein